MYEGSIFFGRQGAAIQAMSGIEIALWDIVGKATGRPVYQLLGGGFRKKFRAYASILFGDTPAETERIGRELAEQGYRAVKFGWGPMGQSEESDIAHVRAAREGLGPDVELMVDAGLCWDTATAIRRAKQFEPFNLDLAGGAAAPGQHRRATRRLVRQQPPMRIAAGEEICDVKEFQTMMDVGGIDVVQVDVTRVGGLAAVEAHRLGLGRAAPAVRQSLVQDRHQHRRQPALRRRPAEHALLRVLRRAGRSAANTDQASISGDRRRHFRARGTGPGHRAERGNRGEISGRLRGLTHATIGCRVPLTPKRQSGGHHACYPPDQLLREPPGLLHAVQEATAAAGEGTEGRAGRPDLPSRREKVR